MIRGKCPTCGKPYQIEALKDVPSFPFCSDRCRLIDLGRWIDGAHAIPGPAVPTAPPQGEDDEDA
jgi:endogenous inhibitor of DNA gyrase (YacG/DUF329 family)